MLKTVYSKRRRLLTALAVATAIGAALCLMAYFRLFHTLQLQSGDFLYRAAASPSATAPPSEIVIVAIDDTSLSQLGSFPSWPRSYHARLTDTLTADGARTVVFDLLFAEPSPDDAGLAASYRQAGNVVIPAMYPTLAHQATLTGELALFSNRIGPLPLLAESAAVGHANVLPDGDGVVRRVPLVIPDGQRPEPALALAAAAAYRHQLQISPADISDGGLDFAGGRIPVDGTRSLLVNYTAAPAGFPTVSYAGVLQGGVDPAVFRDKLVMVGATASGLSDSYWTPLGRMSGAEVHAYAVSTILSGDFRRPVSFPATAAIILILALLSGLAVWRLRVLWASLGVAGLALAYLLAAFTFFDRGLVLDMFYPPLAILGAFVGVNLNNITQERAEKGEITRAFGRYVPPPVVERILASLKGGELNLAGEQREVTVAFADIRGFTSLAENLPAEALVKTLNTYLAAVIRVFLKHGGMISNFGGDSVMAVWNAPTDHPEHPLLATLAAVEAQRAVRELSQERSTLPRVQFGIGVNTGPATTGNMGSQDRLEYTVIGDTVNTAARLTGETPGGQVWLGAATFERVKDRVAARPLEPLRLKGKREPVAAYEVVEIFPDGDSRQLPAEHRV